MWGFLSVLTPCALAVYLWHDLKVPLLARLSAHTREIEQGLVVTEKKSEKEEKHESIPSDLVQVAMLESENWAREQVLSAMEQMREQTGNWDQVRAIYTPNGELN